MTAGMPKASSRRPALGAVLLPAALAALGVLCLHRGGDADAFTGGRAPLAGRQRPAKVARGPVDKAMKERINSVKKTGKLTDAMRMVAAAKVRRAQDGVTKSRPFSDELQGMIKGLVKKIKGSGLEQELPMLKVPEKVRNIGILIISADRGLCGAYNTFVLKKAFQRITDLNQEGIVPKLVLIGKKSLNSLKTRLKGLDVNYTGTFFRMPDTISAKAASEIGDSLRALFLSGEVDKVEIISAKFLSLLTNKPTIRTLLPLSPTGIEDPADETFKLTSEDGKLKSEKEKTKKVKAKNIENDVIFDQPPGTILNSMLPLYLNSQLLSLLFDAQASELSSRMTAMKAATDNAEDLEKRLTTIYNKKRQAAITQEICEISAGALCLESKSNPSGPALGVFDNEDTVGVDFLRELEDGGVPTSPPEPAGPDDRPKLGLEDVMR